MENPKVVQNFENELTKIDQNREFIIEKYVDEIDSKKAKEIEEKLRKAGYIN